MGPRAKALLVVLAILSPVLIAGLLVWSLLGLLLSGSPRHLTILFMAAAGAATAALAASSGDGAAQILSWNSHAAWSAQVLGAGSCTRLPEVAQLRNSSSTPRPQTLPSWPSPLQELYSY